MSKHNQIIKIASICHLIAALARMQAETSVNCRAAIVQACAQKQAMISELQAMS